MGDIARYKAFSGASFVLFATDQEAIEYCEGKEGREREEIMVEETFDQFQDQIL